jgi:hypothetical protein
MTESSRPDPVESADCRASASMGPMSRHRSRLLVALLGVTLLVGCAAPAGAGDRLAAVPTEAPSPRTTPPRVDTGGEAAATPAPSTAPLRTPRPTTVPTPSPAPTPPADSTEPFAMNLFQRGDFIGQYTFEWCVGASIQMTLNMIRPTNDRSRVLQQDLWELARDLSNSPYGGASPIGWTQALNDLGAGPYVLVSEWTIERALATAARAIRETERPVGLVMWSGRHAWMMSGFTSLGDPATEDGFRVTGVRVQDPLYPHGSRTWGPSPQPNALLTPAEVGKQFVPRLHGRVNLGVAPGYLLILPRVP